MLLKELLLDRKFMVTGGALSLSLLLFLFFPSTDRLSVMVQSFIALFIFFFLFPILYVKVILSDSWRSIGFRMDQTLSGWMTVLVAVVIGLSVFFFGYEWWPTLGEVYQLPFSVERSFFNFVLYEMLIFGMLFFYEVFFRGFVMLLFLRRFGVWSVFFQWCILLLFLFVSQSLELDQLLMIFFAPISGWVAYRTQSIGYSFVASSLFFLGVDIFLLLANR